MNKQDREASIAEVLMRAGILQNTFEQPFTSMISGVEYIKQVTMMLQLFASRSQKQNACKQVAQLAGVCERFLSEFADDKILTQMLNEVEPDYDQCRKLSSEK